MPESIARRLGPSGARLATRDGRVVLDVPAGAFAQDVDVAVDPLPLGDDLVLDGRRIRPFHVVQLLATLPNGRPHPGNFARPVRLEVAYTHDDLRGSLGGQVVVYGRAAAGALWQRVNATHDRAARTVRADLDHFSDYLAGIEVNQAILPTVDGFQTALWVGAATASIPLTLPPGTNGMAPRLTLSYSSAGPCGAISETWNTYRDTQPSWVGMGWHLDPGYVQLQEDADPRRGVLVLNGQTYEIIRTGTTGSETPWKCQDDTFLRIRHRDRTENGIPYRYFVVQDKEGTEYRFGYERTDFQYQAWYHHSNDGSDDGSRLDGYYTLNNTDAWRPVRYYLDRILDVHGNRMDVLYRSDLDHNPSSNNTWERALYPTEIRYTSNDAQGLNYQRRVQFTVAPDWSTAAPPGAWPIAAPWREDTPPYTGWAETRRLDKITAQVLVGGTWQTTREYQFGYDYASYSDGPETKKFLRLRWLDEVGGDGTALPRRSFDYLQFSGWSSAFDGKVCPIPLLTRVDNGAGGVVTFGYQAHSWAGNGGGSDKHAQWWAVQTRTVQDSVSGTFATTYQQTGPAWTIKFAPLTNNGAPAPTYPVFRGFRQVLEVDGSTGHQVEHRFYQGLYDGDPTTFNPAQISRSESWPGEDTRDLEEYKGREFEVIYRDASLGDLGKDWSQFAKAAGAANQPYSPPPGNSFQERRDWWVRPIVEIEHRVKRGSRWSRTTYDYALARQGGAQYGSQTDVYEYPEAGDANWVRHSERVFFPLDDGTHYVVAKAAAENLYRNAALESPNPDGSYWERSTLRLYDGNALYTQPIGATPGSYRYRGLETRVRRAVFVGSVLKMADTTYDYDGFGNRTGETRFGGYGDWATWATADPRTTTTSYDGVYRTFPAVVTNPLNHQTVRTWDARWGKPSTITDPNGQMTTLGYDGLGRLASASGPTVNGANGSYRNELSLSYSPPTAVPTSVGVAKRVDTGGSAQWQTTRQFYDGRGLLVQEYVDWAGGQRVVNHRYDGRGLPLNTSVPHVIGDPGGAFAWGDWNANSQPTTSYTHDALRRPRVTTLPGGTTTERFYVDRDTYSIDANRHARRERRDGLGRLVEVVELDGTAATPTTGASLGALPTYGTTTYQYDVGDQLVRMVDPINAVSTATYDRLGRKVAMFDADMGNWAYAYDAIGNLTIQTDARGTVVTMTYDGLDRLVSTSGPGARTWTQDIVAGQSLVRVFDVTELRSYIATDYQAAGLAPPSWTDPQITPNQTLIRAVHFNELKDRISTLRAATTLGALPSQTGDWPVGANTTRLRAQHMLDLRGWLVEYEQYSGIGALQSSFGYDEGGQGANAVGRRTSMRDGAGSTSWGYDAYGRVIAETRTTDGNADTTRWTYDGLDRVRQLTYPDNEVVTHVYGAHALLTDLSSSLGQSLLAGVQYDALGQPLSWTVGGQGTAVQSYWGVDGVYQDDGTFGGPSPFGALRSQRLIGPGSALLVDRLLQHDRAGNLRRLVEGGIGSAPDTQFTYDARDRLIAASTPANETYQYNAAGNLIFKDAAIGYTAPSHPHAATMYQGTSYSYDACGNMTIRGAEALTYDALNRLVRVEENGATVLRCAYDGLGQRVKRVDINGTTTLYAGRQQERVISGGTTTITKYYHAQLGTQSERLVALRAGGQLRYVQTDHLGGVSMVLNPSFAWKSRQRYLPFGADGEGAVAFPLDTVWTDRGFTGQTRDENTQLYWYQSRYYDPVLGRFAQPDTVVPNIAAPQALNRYSYCHNNPLKYVDESGHVPALLFAVGAWALGTAPEAGAALAVGGAGVAIALTLAGEQAAEDWRVATSSNAGLGERALAGLMVVGMIAPGGAELRGLGRAAEGLLIPGLRAGNIARNAKGVVLPRMDAISGQYGGGRGIDLVATALDEARTFLIEVTSGKKYLGRGDQMSDGWVGQSISGLLQKSSRDRLEQIAATLRTSLEDLQATLSAGERIVIAPRDAPVSGFTKVGLDRQTGLYRLESP